MNVWTRLKGVRMILIKDGRLVEMQKQTEANLSALTSIVCDLGLAQARTEKSLASLGEKLDRYLNGKL